MEIEHFERENLMQILFKFCREQIGIGSIELEAKHFKNSNFIQVSSFTFLDSNSDYNETSILLNHGSKLMQSAYFQVIH